MTVSYLGHTTFFFLMHSCWMSEQVNYKKVVMVTYVRRTFLLPVFMSSHKFGREADYTNELS